MTYTPKILTEEQRIHKEHAAIMGEKAFIAYSGILMLGQTSIVDEPGVTAYTDGLNVKYGREFVKTLTDSELRGVILHETKHKLYRHISLWKHLWDRGLYAVSPTGQKVNLVNLAADYVINLEILDEAKLSKRAITLPSGCLVDEKYRGLNTAQVYDLLVREYVDTHGNPLPGKPFDAHGWEEAAAMTAEEQQAHAAAIDAAIRQGAILAGKVQGNVPRGFDALMESKIDWKEQLSEFVSSTCKGSDDTTWRKPSRRWLQYDQVMPTTISESTDRVTIGIDTSGSIGQAALTVFISEVVAILQSVHPNKVDLIYWDSEVASHEVYEQHEFTSLASSTKPAGGGGTSPSCMSTYLNKEDIEPTCIIMLTDGYVGGDWGSEWPAPVLWAITSNEIAGTGATIKVDTAELN